MKFSQGNRRLSLIDEGTEFSRISVCGSSVNGLKDNIICTHNSRLGAVTEASSSRQRAAHVQATQSQDGGTVTGTCEELELV